MLTIKLDRKGLVPAIVQDDSTGEVLMLGYVSEDSLNRTLEDCEVWFYSRSRDEMWHKGEISGNYLHVKSINVDCDGDTVLLKVDPEGPVCHTGNVTCFSNSLEEVGDAVFKNPDAGSEVLQLIFSVIQHRKKEMPDGSYTVELLRGGVERIAQKIIEEAGETAIAGVKRDKKHVVSEASDLLYHLMVLISASGLTLEDVWTQLRSRQE